MAVSATVEKAEEKEDDCETFGCAFKKNRNKYLNEGGPRIFEWKGKKYHVRWKEETTWKMTDKKCKGKCRPPCDLKKYYLNNYTCVVIRKYIVLNNNEKNKYKK